MKKLYYYIIAIVLFIEINFVTFGLVIYNARLSKKHIEGLSMPPSIFLIYLAFIVLAIYAVKKEKLKIVERIFLIIVTLDLMYWVFALIFSFTCIKCNQGLPLLIRWAEQYVW